jgi:hypothetical protein
MGTYGLLKLILFLYVKDVAGYNREIWMKKLDWIRLILSFQMAMSHWIALFYHYLFLFLFSIFRVSSSPTDLVCWINGRTFSFWIGNLGAVRVRVGGWGCGCVGGWGWVGGWVSLFHTHPHPHTHPPEFFLVKKSHVCL